MSDTPREIPKEFYSFESDSPFTHCIECERNLHDSNVSYVVEKAIRNYPEFKTSDTIIDYAICVNCAMKIRESFSKESIQKIDEFLGRNLNRFLASASATDNPFEAGPKTCMITGEKRDELLEYQIYAHCRGKFLDPFVPPYMISDKAVEQILPLISKSTQDILDGFFEKHFSPDPSLMNPVPKLVLV